MEDEKIFSFKQVISKTAWKKTQEEERIDKPKNFEKLLNL